MNAKHIQGKVQSLDVFNKRLDNLIAMRGSGNGYDTYTASGNGAVFEFRTNGVEVRVTGKVSTTEAEQHYNFALPEKYRPIDKIEVYRNNNNAFWVDKGEDGQPPFIEGRIVRSGDPDGGNIEFTAVYQVDSVTIAELEDARVGYDGTSYATAGTAIRRQVGELAEMVNGASKARLSIVTIEASAWKTEADGLHSQVVTIDGISEFSKVDLLLSVEQLAIFHNKDVAFVTENEDGVVTVFAIGDKPTQDYTMQVSITEVQV